MVNNGVDKLFTALLHCNASNMVFKFWKMTKSGWGQFALASPSLQSLRELVPVPHDLRPWLWPACLYVCLFVCLSARTAQKPHFRISPNFLYMCYLWPWLGPPLTATGYVMYFRFYRKTSYFYTMQGTSARIQDDTYVSSSSCFLGAVYKFPFVLTYLFIYLLTYRGRSLPSVTASCCCCKCAKIDLG